MSEKYFYGKHYIDSKDIIEVKKSLKNQLSQGPILEKFEKRLAKYFGAKYCLAVSSATAALHLSIKALNLKKNSLAFTSAMTFVATTNACLYNNLKLNILDINKHNFNIDLDILERRLSNLSKIQQKQRKIIIPVHFGGLPVDLRKLKKISKKFNCFVIEDASQAMGAKFDGNLIGDCKYSDFCVFSLHPVKSITSGEGGLIFTNNTKYYEKLKLLRNHGISKSKKNFWESDMKLLGYNYKITEFQCALGYSQLHKLNKFIKKRNLIAKYYIQKLKRSDLDFQSYKNKAFKHAYHYFIIKFNDKINEKKLLDIIKFLKKYNIYPGRQYKPIHFHSFYRKIFKGSYPNSENYYKSSLQIPIYPSLRKKDLNFIIDKINKINLSK